MKRKRLHWIVAAVLAVLASPLFAPQLLAFPYKAEVAGSTIRSVEPIDAAELDPVMDRALAKVAASPLAEPGEHRDIFLTDGGWRWTWLANSTRGAFALTRPLTEDVIVNRSAPARDIAFNGAPVGGDRSLSGLLAHEFTHGLIRRHFGQVASLQFPRWLVEGYCDYIAGESSLDPAEVAALDAADSRHPALLYYHGRQRAEATLKKNGGSVERLFAEGS